MAHLSSEAYSGGSVTSAVTPAETATPTFSPSEDTYTHVHTILIIIIFCIVCFLLLVAFVYTFCFHCSLQTAPKDERQNSGCSLDREDATFRRSSSSPRWETPSEKDYRSWWRTTTWTKNPIM